MAATKEKDGKPAIKKYKALTPINLGEGKRIEEGASFEAPEDQVADLVEARAIVEA